ncbi:MAG: hypothetical protein JXQ83_10360, partial [Candidatus Glassbacteria bacterium]|nr:hypothetical protein [Candidatus Glassbacteria bacterium]
MAGEEKLYLWENRSWKWEDLAARLDLLERRACIPGRTRYWPALQMVEGAEVLDIGCNAGMFAGLL